MDGPIERPKRSIVGPSSTSSRTMMATSSFPTPASNTRTATGTSERSTSRSRRCTTAALTPAPRHRLDSVVTAPALRVWSALEGLVAAAGAAGLAASASRPVPTAEAAVGRLIPASLRSCCDESRARGSDDREARIHRPPGSLPGARRTPLRRLRYAPVFELRGHRVWPEDPEVLRQPRAARVRLDLRLRAQSGTGLSRASSGDL